ncbi:two-component regulator propeller domain-containing protein, partial [Clostridium sp.]|uniref:ligand-binding sensor domain-containing protein n=1 Tax=Clostridium sp. TaxID=1506 RepID=UPI0034639388
MQKVVRNLSKILVIIFMFNFIFSIDIVKAKSMDKGFRFNRITLEDGISQGSIEGIIQDEEGYMWFATADGLNRYNGYDFKVYKYKDEDDNSLTSSYIGTLIEDSDGYLWVGTNLGLNKLDTYDDTITRYVSRPEENNSLSNNNIISLLEDSKGNIWVGTENGLNKYNKEDDKFTQYMVENSHLSNEFINCIYEDKDGFIWIGTKDGLNILDPKNNTIKNYYSGNDNNTLSGNYINKIYEDKEGYIWIGTRDHGLNRYDRENKILKRYLMDENDKNSISSDIIQAIYEDDMGTLWIGTKNGLNRYDESKDNFTRYKSINSDNKTLVDNNIMSIYQDKTGLIWIGTYNGISYFNPMPIFENYRSVQGDENSLSDNMISGIYEDKEGILWVGTISQGLNEVDRKNNKVTRHKYDKNNNYSISDDRILGITGDKDDNIWIATNYGLNKYDKKTKKFKRFLYNKDDENSLVNNELRYLYVDDENNLWIGSRHGVCSLDIDTEQFTSYNELLKKEGVDDLHIVSIHEDKEGIMWLGAATYGGLIRFDKENDKVDIYKHEKDNKETLSSNSIRGINEDNEGNLWIATSHGVNKFNKKSGLVTRFTEEQGLSNNYSYGVLMDEEDNPWISTNYGLSKYDKAKDRFINFTEADGLQSNEFNVYAFFKSENGEMFFGGINGVSSFFPKNILGVVEDSEVVIEEFLVQGQSRPINNKMRLKHNEGYFSIDFFVPSYDKLRKTQYAYMLEGMDKEWIYTDDRHYASYTNVPGGDYTFKIKAINKDGSWTEETKLKIYVGTPPWKSWWAYSIYVGIILTIIYLIWNYVKILEGLVRIRTKELNNKLEENSILYSKLLENEQCKNDYFLNLSHELKTPLNVILSAVQLIDSKITMDNLTKFDTSKYMGIISKNSSRLLRIINDIIDTSKIEAGSYKINPRKQDIVYMVEEVALSMKSYIESNGLNLIIDPYVEEKVVSFDATEIERCIVNLISNAVKFTKEDGYIYIYIYD